MKSISVTVFTIGRPISLSRTKRRFEKRKSNGLRSRTPTNQSFRWNYGSRYKHTSKAESVRTSKEKCRYSQDFSNVRIVDGDFAICTISPRKDTSNEDCSLVRSTASTERIGARSIISSMRRYTTSCFSDFSIGSHKRRPMRISCFSAFAIFFFARLISAARCLSPFFSSRSSNSRSLTAYLPSCMRTERVTR